MSGYRESSYDPNAYEQPGRPLRPFNWVQWTGVVFIAAALIWMALYFAGKTGLVAPIVDSVPVATSLAVLGTLLVNSRRAPGIMVGSDQLARNRRVMLITVALLVLLFGAVFVLEFAGRAA